jgi:hypothetical protein
MRRVPYEVESLSTEELVIKLNEFRHEYHNIREEEEYVFEELVARIQRGQITTPTVEPRRVTTPTAEAVSRPTSPIIRAFITRGFTEGDRILIVNKVTPAGYRINSKDKSGVVRGISLTGRVLITTDNRVDTWRFPRNLIREE